MKKSNLYPFISLIFLVLILVISILFKTKKNTDDLVRIWESWEVIEIVNTNIEPDYLGPVRKEINNQDSINQIDNNINLQELSDLKNDKKIIDWNRIITSILFATLITWMLILLTSLSKKARKRNKRKQLKANYPYSKIHKPETIKNDGWKKDSLDENKKISKTKVTWNAFLKRDELKRNSIQIKKESKRLFHFNVPKEFEKYSQDNYQITNNIFVLSDWASTSIFSEIWSKILTDLYVDFIESKSSDLKKFILDNLSKYSNIWKQEVEWEDWNKLDELPYYAKNKLKDGSHASLCWATINKNELQYNIVWDSCIIHIANDALNSIPVKSSKDFWSFPDLICTKSEYNKNQNVLDRIHSGTINLNKGDEVIFATDGIAEYIINLYEKFWIKEINSITKLIYKSKDIAKVLTEWKTKWIKETLLTDDDSTYIYYKHN